MTAKRWSEIKQGKRSKERVAEIDAQVQEDAKTLRALREAVGKTQGEIAQSMDVSQEALSTFERRDEHRISSIRAYVEALGGTIEVTAVINGKRYPVLV